jgi:hypothetical protein
MCSGKAEWIPRKNGRSLEKEWMDRTAVARNPWLNVFTPPLLLWDEGD